jgi:hypothetical protein
VVATITDYSETYMLFSVCPSKEQGNTDIMAEVGIFSCSLFLFFLGSSEKAVESLWTLAYL